MDTDLLAAGLPVVGSWDPSHWSALADLIVALVAGAALWIAREQLREAREVRWEQAQPYVVAFMEPDHQNPRLVDLVVRNFGQTAAFDVWLNIHPSPSRSDNSGEVWLPSLIHVLAPGQEWRTYWDNGPDRVGTHWPDAHNAEVEYRDSRGTVHTTSGVLDWSAHTGREFVQRYGLHDVGKSLVSMNKLAEERAKQRRNSGGADGLQ